MRRALILVALAAAPARAERPAPPPPPCTDDAQLDGPSTKKHTESTAGYLGKTAAQVVHDHGEPECKSPKKWRYAFPPGCSYERDVITLRFAGGKVVRVTVVHVFTGEECAFDE